MLHHQIIRNAYVVAQSQLLQLAKQMEFDADLSMWEEESSEKMQEFWDQSRQSVADFCARVHSSMDPLPSLAAEMVKSPRKKLESTMITAVPSAPASPTPASRNAPAHEITPTPEPTSPPPRRPSVQVTEAPAVPSAPTEAIEPASSGAPRPPSPAETLPLPSTTPGTALRTKRTLGTAVLRSTKKPDTTDEPRPPLRPPARFRSSFLNKSLCHAMEEKQAGSSDRDLDDSIHEPSPWDASPVAEPPQDRTESRALPGPSLDALRTRLESVRRASTTPATTTLGTLAVERRTSTLVRPLSDTPSKLPPTEVGGRRSRDMGDEQGERNDEQKDDRSYKQEDKRHEPTDERDDPALVERPSAHPAALTAPAAPAAPTAPTAPAPVSPSRAPESKVPVAVPPTSRTPGRERPMVRPARPRTPGASPLRSKVGTVTVPPFLQPATPGSGPAAPARPASAARSPGRLREDRLSPFRSSTKEESPIRSRLPVSPVRMGASKIPSPARKPVAPVGVRPASPEGSARAPPPRPASVADVRSAAPGLGARIKGLLGLAAVPQSETSRPASPRARVREEDRDERAMPGSFDEAVAAPVRPLSMSTSAVPKRASQAGTPVRPAPLPKKGVPVRPLARPGSAMRVSSATRPTFTYDTDGKRRKLSQRPLGESTNVEERAATEDALKSKLTTAQGAVRSTSHTVRVSSGSVRGAPPPSRPWTAQRSSTLSTQNVFQQAAAPPPTADEEELPDVASEYSDSDDEASIRKRSQEPSWTRGRELEALLLQQASVDPDEIFGCQVGPVPLDTMLPPRKGDRRRLRHRTSSANWSGPDGLAQWEIDRYNERMGIHSTRADS
ncbi:hypothetical protein MNAN1_001199 [Malassezia nana]|uniref:Inner centromere protein ARK-binding domain-containing protein n=1 Tax=Malassezia nana TaxID=180528 RepID=A0AAF0EQ89_9BASI|nr:hypothetical protein MNAN1_001199 [Malassezia nana]